MNFLASRNNIAIAVILTLSALIISPWRSCAASKTSSTGSPNKPAAVASATQRGPIQAASANDYNSKALHRVDFRVKGSSCPVCLNGIQRRMQREIGTVRAAIMLKEPYAGVLIYDASKTTREKILAKGLDPTKKEVGYVNVSDAPIEKLPVIIVPHMAAAAANTP